MYIYIYAHPPPVEPTQATFLMIFPINIIDFQPSSPELKFIHEDGTRHCCNTQQIKIYHQTFICFLTP